MNYIRVTAHFNTVEDAKKAYRFLLTKKSTGHFNNIEARNKKVSISNDDEGLAGWNKKQVRLILEEGRDNVLCWLGDCKGLSYTILVSR